MEEKRFKVDFTDGSYRCCHFLLTQSQMDLLSYLVKNDISTYNAEMPIINDTDDYITI